MKTKFSIILLVVFLIYCLEPAGGTVRAAAAAIPAILYVAPGGDCAGMLPCYSSPQAAVDAAPAGSVIRIAAGSYSPPAGNDQVLQITKSLILQGGLRTTDWYDPQPFAFPTVLDAQHLGRVILIQGNPGQPVEVVLDGFQLTNGQAGQGAGISGTGAQLTVQRCVISNNQASGSGGGIFLSDSSSLILQSSRVMNNTAGDKGGGIALNGAVGNTKLTQSWIFGNQAASGGGGVSLTGGQVELKTIMLVDNTVTQSGAAGAGLIADGTEINLAYTTIARNTGGSGSGLSLSGSAALAAANMLVAGQAVALSFIAPSTGAVDGVLWGGGATWANGVNTAGSVTVTHAYSGDPLFTGLDPADLITYFHIGELSPARDRSVSTDADYQDIDFLGVYAAVADLGADEYIYRRVGGTIIHVNTQAGGDIEVGTADGAPENRRGAFFWNGAKWVTNDTAAHMFYTDILTGARLKQYTLVADLNGSSPDEQDIGSYHVSRSTYAYTTPAQAGGAYRIEAARYRITKSGSQEIILLNSRGNGYGQASFDIYIQYAPDTTIAFRYGSAWFNYSESLDLASQRSIHDLTGRAGILPTCDLQAIDRSRYWLDMNGGSDMGGLTYFFHTTNLPNRTSALGTCFPDEFRVKYMQLDTNALEEFRLRPIVYSETLLQNTYLPIAVR